MSLEYFETDQIKFAVRLWRAVKKAGGAEFDVLKFTQNWGYAESVLATAVTAEDDAVSATAIEIVQLRTQFLNQEPARAKKLGAPVANPSQSTTSARTSTSSSYRDPPDETPPPSQYIKTLR